MSYAQRFEDLYLLRCFGHRSDGFYVDIGSGHPVHDNVSFAFYLEGWRGVTVEPNPKLAHLTRAVRPRDRHVEALVGAAPGSAVFHLVEHLHGLSTTIEEHARAAQARFGKRTEAITATVITLRDLSERHVPSTFEFLKVDVEGAERDVLLGGDWRGFRPKVAVVEALAPYTLTPAWEGWEPFLRQCGYRHVWFDSLNRYYLAEEASDLAPCFEQAPGSFDDALQFRNLAPALGDERHPDHRLATLIAGADMATHPVVGALGPEPLSAAFAAATLARHCRGKKTSIKAVLLDQRVVAGLGNIYADEVLFRARLHPERPAGSLSPQETEDLWHAVRAVLGEARGIELEDALVGDVREVEGAVRAEGGALGEGPLAPDLHDARSRAGAAGA